MYDTVLCAPAAIRNKYIYNTLPQYTKDTVLCAPAEIRTKYVLNTLPILGTEYDWPAWVLCVAIEYVRNTLQYVAYHKTTQYKRKYPLNNGKYKTQARQYMATTQRRRTQQYSGRAFTFQPPLCILDRQRINALLRPSSPVPSPWS